MSQQIQVRRGTAAAWTAANPTLAIGEFGFETDTYKVKIGDGATAWNALGYWLGDISSHTAAADPHPGYRLESAQIATADIADNAVTFAKTQNVVSNNVFLGRYSGANGDIQEVSMSQATSMLGLTAGIQFVIDGGGVVLTTGVKGDLMIPFACTINEWTLLADQSGSVVVDIWKDTYANFPPTVADVITASAKPTISSATKGQSSTLTGWTTSIAAGDTLRFNVNSVTTIQRVTLTLKVTRT